MGVTLESICTKQVRFLLHSSNETVCDVSNSNHCCYGGEENIQRKHITDQ